LKALQEKFPDSADPKARYYAGKYTDKDAIAQLTATLAYLKENADIADEVPAAADAAPADAAPADAAPADAAPAEEMMEGGDEAGAEAEAAVDPAVPA
jgi:hypothetical protein